MHALVEQRVHGRSCCPVSYGQSAGAENEWNIPTRAIMKILRIITASHDSQLQCYAHVITFPRYDLHDEKELDKPLSLSKAISGHRQTMCNERLTILYSKEYTQCCKSTP